MDSFARLLTDAKIRNAATRDKPYKLSDGGGLFLLVQPNGTKAWRYKFRLGATESVFAIGVYPEVQLAAARDAHRAARILVAAGKNPVHERQADRERTERERKEAEEGLFETVLADWRDKTEPDLAPQTITQRTREIAKYLEPEFTGKNMKALGRQDCARVIKRVERTAPEVARNLRTYLSAIFEHAIDLGIVDGNPVPPPRALKRRQVEHHKAMDLSRVGQFLRDVRACTAEPGTKAAMLLVVMAVCRKSEAAGAEWDEFNLEDERAGSWDIPAERMKARRPHWVPLPRQAVLLLRELREFATGPLLFPNRRDPSRPMANRSLNALLDRIGYSEETVHGFRSVFSTRYNALDRANADVVERCLAHAPKDAVRAAYNRHEYADERRAMLQDWADWLDAQAAPKLALAA